MGETWRENFSKICSGENFVLSEIPKTSQRGPTETKKVQMSMEPKVLLLGKVIWYRLESCLELNKAKVGLVMLLRLTSNSNANYLRNKDPPPTPQTTGGLG